MAIINTAVSRSNAKYFGDSCTETLPYATDQDLA